MSDQLANAFAAEASGNLAENAPPSEQAEILSEQSDAPETPEKVAETDEQQNERVVQEAAARAEKKAKGVQKRMDELTADKYAERKRADELATSNARLLAMIEERKVQPTPQGTGAPTRDQYQDYESFLIAQAEHKAEVRAESKTRELLEQTFRATQEQSQQAAFEQHERETTSRYLERQRAFAEKTPDFVETMEDAEVQVPPTVFGMLRRMDDGPAIAYQLVKNPQLVQQFFTQPPELHGVLLGQISATLKASPSISKAAPPGKPSKSTPGTSSEPPSDPEKFWEWSAKHLRT